MHRGKDKCILDLGGERSASYLGYLLKQQILKLWQQWERENQRPNLNLSHSHPAYSQSPYSVRYHSSSVVPCNNVLPPTHKVHAPKLFRSLNVATTMIIQLCSLIFDAQKLTITNLRDTGHYLNTRSATPFYEGVLISPYLDLLPDVLGRNQ